MQDHDKEYQATIRNYILESHGLVAWLWLFKMKARPKPSGGRQFGLAYLGLAQLGSQPEAGPKQH
jgi:hypothetical protein